MSVLLACFLYAMPACAPDLSRAAQPSNPVAAVEVDADSSSLSIGSRAMLSFKATDSAGDPVPVPVVQYTALTPELATVASDGSITAVQLGVASFLGVGAGDSAIARIPIIAPPDLASHNFNDSTLGPYSNPSGIDLDFPIDPTNSGHGRVARFHYVGANGDANRNLEFTYPRRWGQPIYFIGDFYVPLNDLVTNEIVRKLIYWQSHKNYGKYPGDGGLATGRTVVLLSGTDLVVDATYNPDSLTGKSSDDVRTVQVLKQGMQGNRWYTLEVYQQMESAIGRADGVLQVRLDGELLFDRSDMTWTDPNWVGDVKYGVPFDAADIYFEHFSVGDQVTWSRGSFDEYRYWDNVQFSTRPFTR